MPYIGAILQQAYFIYYLPKSAQLAYNVVEIEIPGTPFKRP